MKLRRSMLKDTVSVEKYAGESAYGPLYAAPLQVKCNVDATLRLERNDAGDVVQQAIIYVHPSDDDVFVPKSRITIEGRLCQVLTINYQLFRSSIVYTRVTCA